MLPRLPPLRGKIENDPLSLPAAALDKKLVPHYDDDDSDSNHDEEEQPVSTLFPISLSASEQLDALFNKCKPNSNTQNPNEPINEHANKELESEENMNETNFDSKLFKRRRRIEVIKNPKSTNGNQFVNSDENAVSNDESIEILEDIPNSESEDAPSNLKSQLKIIPYNNFVKSGVEFSETNSNEEVVHLDANDKKFKECRQMQQHKKNEINNVGRLMRNKLKFLSESTTPATSAQIMYIQYEVY